MVVALGAAGTATATTGDDITGSIWQDYDSNGVFDTYESGLPGIEVIAYDSDGSIAGPVLTGADGTYTLPVTSDATQWRVEANLPDGAQWDQWRPSVVGRDGDPANGTTVQFATVADGVGAAGVDFSFQVPTSYVENTPRVYLPIIQYGTIDGEYAASPASGAILWDAESTSGQTAQPVPQTGVVPFSQVGATNGTAMTRADEVGGVPTVFASAYMRRHSAFGPGGIGAIYRVTPDGADWSAPTASADVYVDLAAHGIDLGGPDPSADPTDPNGLRPSRTAENPTYEWARDAQAWNNVGRAGIGQIALSPDERYLFAVNLHNRSLIRIDTGGDPTAPPVAVDEFRFDDVFTGDIRPYGVSADPLTGTMYVTATDTAETSQDRFDLHGYVYSFDAESPATLTPVLDFPLDFDRPTGLNPYFEPWATEASHYSRPTIKPQPVVAAVQVLHGDLVIPVRDLTGDVWGTSTYLSGDPDDGDDRLTSVRSEGDVFMAAPNGDGTFTMENNGVHKGVTGAGALKGDGGPGGFRFLDTSLSNIAGHDNESTGSVVVMPSRPDGIMTTGVHVANGSLQEGTRRLYHESGATYEPSGAVIRSTVGNPVTAKGNGLGSATVLASAAPIEIGNYVWYDNDNDGVQDPDESPVESATVNLYEVAGDGTRTLVSSTLTNERGEYYFSSFDEDYQLMTNTDYVVGVDNPDDYAAGGPLENWYPTVPDTGDGASVDADRNDSDGLVEATGEGDFPYAAITTGGPGENDHTIDFGYSNIDYEFDKRTVSGPTQSPEDDGTWVLEYELVAENTGAIDGAYGLADDLTGYGEGIIVTDTEVVSGPDGAALNADWDGVDDMRVITEDMPITAGSTVENEAEHVYLLRVTVALEADPETGEALADAEQLGCRDGQTSGDNDPTTGLFNEATMDPDNHSDFVDDECGELPKVVVDKSVTSEPAVVDPVTNPGEYTITYGLTVTNETGASTTYDLTDPLRFGEGIEIVDGSIETIALDPADTVLNDAYDGVSDDVVAADVPIDGNGVHTYEVSVRYTVDLPDADDEVTPDPSACADAAVGAGGTTTGLYNEASTSFNGYPDYDDECREVGEVTHVKELVSAEPVGEGQWEIVYQIEVSNKGVESVVYDLDDELHFGAGIDVASSAVSQSPDGVALEDPAWDGLESLRIASGVTMPGTDDEGYAPHVYQVSVLADVPLSFADPVDGIDPATCGDEAVDHSDPQERAFLNVSHLTDEAGAVEDDDACAAPPEFAIDKTTDAASPAPQGDGTWLVTYGIDVTNTGEVAGDYDLADLLRFDDSIEVLETGVTGAPEGVQVNDGWTGSEEELDGSVIAVDVSLEAGAVHTYEVQVLVTIEDPTDPAAVTEAFTCPEPGSDEQGGLNNLAGIWHNDLAAEDVVCPEPAVVELDKTIAHGPDLDADGAYTITYEIEVTNAGQNDTAYDLTDELHYGEGIAVTDAEVTSTPDGVEASAAWTGDGDDLVIATGVPIAAGTVHVYEVTVDGTIAESVLGTAAMGCPPAGTDGGTGGFLNVATVTGAGLVLVDDVCASPPDELPTTGANGLTILAMLGALAVLAGAALITVRARNRQVG
ncbi:SdrD B-like domain-containing protein [Ruania halotolerans]|uniref:SdrD B-like domain-containing protein n=1 Tax=Ruania halotolerans TaxID=2897773 RepID=UPI001E4E1047|nr:SdrD B-like domain-containing protein [Ruania halotolerans]UFU06793.1 LPXTG cell wall anchor domain-containing protein [Ruania halotolerans]